MNCAYGQTTSINMSYMIPKIDVCAPVLLQNWKFCIFRIYKTKNSISLFSTSVKFFASTVKNEIFGKLLTFYANVEAFIASAEGTSEIFRACFMVFQVPENGQKYR